MPVDEHSLAVNRRIVAVRLTLSLLVFGAGLWFLLATIPEAPGWLRAASFTLAAGVLLIGLRTICQMLVLLLRRSGLLVNAQGIVDYTARLGFVPWSNITRIQRSRFAGLDTISVEVADFDEFLSGLGQWDRLMWRFARTRHVEPAIISSFLHRGDQLHDLLQDRMRAG